MGDGTITITVIRDVNANSNYDAALEVGVAGIEVTVTDDAGVQLVELTNASGVATFDPASDLPTLTGGRYRVEATIPASMPYLQPAQVAGGNLSPLTDFVDVSGGAPAALTMGVINPADYVGPTPGLVTSYQWPSNPPPTGAYPHLVDDQRSLISFNYSDRGGPPDGAAYPAPTQEATQAETGTVYGLAYQRTTGNFFSGAFAKRITAYGPGEQGGIYLTSGGTTTLWGVVPGAGTTAHGPIGAGDFGFWDAVGKEGLGDLDLSEDGTSLFVVNLNDRQLYEFDATAPTMGAPLSVTPIPNPGCPAAIDWRPFGLGVRDGVLHVGGVCSGESTGARADLEAAVWTFDIASSTFGATPALTQPLDFLKGSVAIIAGDPVGQDIMSHWNAWLPTYDTVTPGRYSTNGDPLGAQTHRRPIPMLVDLAVEADGSLVLGFRDRTGDQFGFEEVSPRGPATVDSVMIGGDLNRACRNPAGGYNWEGTGGCPNNHVAPNGSTGQDPAVVEYYPGEYFHPAGAHQETSQGAIALALSEPRMAVTTMDPHLRVTAGGAGFYDRQSGLMWSDTGANAYELFAEGRIYVPASATPSSDYTFGKGNGLADLEVIAALAPIEIGNYVWFDADRDGVQDPGEAPIADVTVELYDAAGSLIGTTVTDANGNYYFGGTTGAGMLDDNELAANSTYYIRIPDAVGANQQAALTDYVPTVQDSGSATDTTDSDGGLNGVHDEITIQTGDWGFNNHTYDFGFYLPVYDLALRKTLAAGQPSAVNPGDLVTFTITVINQGTNTASNITVVDYIPDGMTLEDPDWTAGPDNTATIAILGSLAPGASTTVDITLRLSPDPFEGVKDNYAEISSFTDEWGEERVDEDSTPDDEFGDDTLVDDEVENGGSDEDDQDIASLSVLAVPPPTTTTTTLPTTTVPPPAPPAPPTVPVTAPDPGALPATGGGSGLRNVALLLLLGGGIFIVISRLRRRAVR